MNLIRRFRSRLRVDPEHDPNYDPVFDTGTIKIGRRVYEIRPFVNLEDVDLHRTDLRGANLDRANLSGADLHKSDLRGVNLSGADLRGANLEKANLYGAIFVHANLTGANLSGANLERANFLGAHLRGAKFENANLEGVNLSWANYEGANFDNTDLSRVRFERLEPYGAPAPIPTQKLDYSKVKYYDPYEDEECGICYEPLVVDKIDDYVLGDPVKTACNHKFHEGCLLTWKQTGRGGLKCPLCRREGMYFGS